jgi:hypothetical protein
MAITINEFDRYNISGKIISKHKNNGTFTIFVTSPFTCEIKFYCSLEHYHVLHPPAFKYNWMDLQDSHPSISEASAYYNTQHKCFYKKESNSKSEWKPADFADIYDDNPNLLRRNTNRYPVQYDLFLNKYVSILQKEQLCNFSAYALHKTNRDWYSVQGPQVARHPDDYFWIYNPNSFYAEKWEAESIDDLVKEIRPSRECVNQLLESYEDDDREADKEKWERRWEKIKSTPKRLQNWLDAYDKLMIAFITLVSGAIGAEIIKGVISIITSLKN